MSEPAFDVEVIHREPGLAVLNKPTDVSLLADRTGAPCLWEALPRALNAKPYLVHRLDKGTSGVLLVALNPETQRALTRSFQQQRVRKYYQAWVTGLLMTPVSQFIDLPLRKGRKSRYRVAGARDNIRRTRSGWHLENPDAGGHESLTRVRSLRHEGGRTLLLAAPTTGRTHQLRVHLSWIGHPILGDHLYGRPDAPEQKAPRLQLHCHRLVVPGMNSFSAAPGRGWLE